MAGKNRPIKISKKLQWLAAMAIFMQSLDTTILNTALPSIAHDLNHSPLSMQSVIVAYALTLALLIPVSGWLSDRFGTRKIFSVAVLLFTLGSLCCAMSNTLGLLVASRILQAVGGSMMVPVSRLSLIYAYPKEQLLRVINFTSIPGLVGPVIGPTLGGWLVEVASWHWIFLINIPIGIAGIIFAQKVMPDFTGIVKRFDIIGLILFSGGLVLFSLGLELGSDGYIDYTMVLAITIVSVLFILSYVMHAKRISYSIINIDLFKIRTLRIGLTGSLFTRLGIGSMPFLFPLLLQVGFGHSATTSGIMLMAAAIFAILAKSWVVPLVKRYGYRNILISNTLILSAVIGFFAFPGSSTPLVLLIPALAVYGTINSIQFTCMNTISLSDLDNTSASGGNGLLAITQQLSMSLGVSIGALLLRTFERTEELTSNNTEYAFKYTFLALAAITALSSITFFRLRKDDGSQMSGHRRHNI